MVRTFGLAGRPTPSSSSLVPREVLAQGELDDLVDGAVSVLPGLHVLLQLRVFLVVQACDDAVPRFLLRRGNLLVEYRR